MAGGLTNGQAVITIDLIDLWEKNAMPRSAQAPSPLSMREGRGLAVKAPSPSPLPPGEGTGEGTAIAFFTETSIMCKTQY